MPPPTKQEVKVATDTLRTEATVWSAQSDTLATIADEADGMSLTVVEAGIFGPMTSAYNGIVAMIGARCHEGSQRMDEIGRTLRTVADIYELEDAENLHAIDNLY